MIRKFSLFDNKNTEKKADPFAASRVISIAPHHELLKPNERRGLLKRIKSLVRAPERYYKALYEPLIENLADYLQALPDLRTIEDPSHAVEWLDSALLRAAYAVNLRHKITLPPNASADTAEADYPLWTYVVFSSALLWQIGKLSTHYTISLCNQQGKVTEDWNPMTGSLAEAGKFYKIRDYTTDGPESFRHLTPVLARHIMPDEGFQWIASNDQALRMWLAALVDEEGASGSVVSILSIARMILENHPSLKELLKQLKLDAEALHDLLNELKKIEALEEKLRSDPNLPPVKISEPPETEAGEAFYEWLKRGLQNGTIPTNSPNAHVHITKEGVILAYPEIFVDFVREFHRFKDWIIVYKQFNALGLTKMSGSDTWFGKFFVEKNVVPSPLDMQLGAADKPQNRYGPGRTLSQRERVTATTGPVQPQNQHRAREVHANTIKQAQMRQQNILRQNRQQSAQEKHPVKGMMVTNSKLLYGQKDVPGPSSVLKSEQNTTKVKQKYPILGKKYQGPKNVV